MITNYLNYEKLRVKRDNLADEARLIRRREKKYRKWVIKTLSYSHSGLEQNNYLEDLRGKGWQVEFVKPQGRPGMSETERAEYKAGKWSHIARVRKLNPRHDEGIRYILYSHRTSEVRNEARATHLAIAYMKGVPYSVVETKSKNANKAIQRKPDLKKIWKLVQKYPTINDESVEDIKHLESWLRS
jgi:hypothetical protein